MEKNGGEEDNKKKFLEVRETNIFLEEKRENGINFFFFFLKIVATVSCQR